MLSFMSKTYLEYALVLIILLIFSKMKYAYFDQNILFSFKKKRFLLCFEYFVSFLGFSASGTVDLFSLPAPPSPYIFSVSSNGFYLFVLLLCIQCDYPKLFPNVSNLLSAVFSISRYFQFICYLCDFVWVFDFFP